MAWKHAREQRVPPPRVKTQRERERKRERGQSTHPPRVKKERERERFPYLVLFMPAYALCAV